jgi:hypothetical protein
VLSGLGNDTVSLNAAGSALTVGGAVVATDQGGKNTLGMGNAAGLTRIGGDLILLGFADNGATRAVRLGAGQADVIGGRLSITSLSSNPVTVRLGVTAQGITVGKDLTITTDAGNDSIQILGQALGKGTVIGGNTTANLGNGDNFFATETGRIDGGGRVVANTFSQDPGWTLLPTLQLSNFP